MKKENILRYVGQTVRVLLKNNNNYTINIQSVDDNCFYGKDKFNRDITIDNVEVSVILEA